MKICIFSVDPVDPTDILNFMDENGAKKIKKEKEYAGDSAKYFQLPDDTEVEVVFYEEDKPEKNTLEYIIINQKYPELKKNFMDFVLFLLNKYRILKEHAYDEGIILKKNDSIPHPELKSFTVNPPIDQGNQVYGYQLVY